MWISPSFHLKAIRAYDALVTNQLPAGASLESLPPVSSQGLTPWFLSCGMPILGFQ